MARHISRRETLRTLGAVVGGTFFPWSAHATNDAGEPLILPDPERLIPVSWGDQAGATFPVAIKVSAWDRVGLLKDVSTLLADEKVNILSVLTNTHDDRTVTLLLTLEVEGIPQLLRLIHKLESVRDVVEVRRDAAPAVTQRERAAAS